VPEPEQEPALKPLALERAPMRQERAPELELLQPEPGAQVPEQAQIWLQKTSLPEIARAAQVLDSPLLPLERGRRLGSQALPLCLKSPCWQAAPQVVNKTQQRRNLKP